MLAQTLAGITNCWYIIYSRTLEGGGLNIHSCGRSKLDTGKSCAAHKLRCGRGRETPRGESDIDSGAELKCKYEPQHAPMLVFYSARWPRISGGAEENQRDAGGDFKADGRPVKAGKHHWRSQAGGAQLGLGQVKDRFGRLVCKVLFIWAVIELSLQQRKQKSYWCLEGASMTRCQMKQMCYFSWWYGKSSHLHSHSLHADLHRWSRRGLAYIHTRCGRATVCQDFAQGQKGPGSSPQPPESL